MAHFLTRTTAQVSKVAGIAGMAALGVVAPDVAARRAAAMFMTLPRTQGRRQDNRTCPGDVVYVPGPGHTKLVTESWGSGPVVYLVHGWGGWRGQVAAFAEPIAERGLRVIAFDGLSHGDSSPGELGPDHSTAAELAASLEAVVAEFGQPHAVVAHSLGCAATSMAMADGMTPSRLAMVAPNPDLKSVAEQLGRTLRLRPPVIARMVGDIVAATGRPMADFDLLTLPQRAPMPPPRR